MCVFVYVCIFYLFICVTSPCQTENDTDLKFGRHTPIDLIWKRFLFVFSIKSPWRLLASKNCRVTWIFRISPRWTRFFHSILKIKIIVKNNNTIKLNAAERINNIQHKIINTHKIYNEFLQPYVTTRNA